LFASGIEGENLCLVLTDTQIVKESFLEDINSILNTGEVPNLFLPEDFDKIVNGLRPKMAELKRIDTVYSLKL
jgi:dynein heavy chain